MRYKFTKTDRRNGGWSRARQWADYRRSNPTAAERTTREMVENLLSPNLLSLNLAICYEYEIQHSDGMPQWLDIAILQGDRLLSAIEIDGSRDWHNPCYPGSKMYELDQKKRQWCDAHNVRLLSVSWHDYGFESAIKEFLCGKTK